MNKIAKWMTSFLKLEAASGIILCLTAFIAILLANSSKAPYYQALQQFSVEFQWNQWSSHTSLLFCVNDGLMALFFLLIGLELKREFLIGTLTNAKQILLPGMAALGGMIVPAIIYMLVNRSNTVGLQGWAVPVATDIAFALAVLSLWGKKVPIALKLFLMTLAIFDDVGAIMIIAVFNTHALSGLFLLFSMVILMGLWLLNRFGEQRLFPYLFSGFLLWVFLLKSGIHPTLAGILLALFIPVRERLAPLQRLERGLHPWVAYFVMPLFAFMNAGLSFHGLQMSDWLDTVTLGIVLGLVLGKQMGVFGLAWAMIKWRLASLPEKTSWLAVYGVALLGGIGFTMSLFLGTLAFENDFPNYLMKVRLGVLTGSLLSGILGAIVLHIAFKTKRIRA